MANKIVITPILPGDARSQYHIYLLGDGSQELTDEVLVDPVSLGLPTITRLSIELITYNLSGFSARIEYDTGLVDDKMIWVLNELGHAVDFNPWGGLLDRSGFDGTGKLQLTTTGFGAGDQGSILLMVRHS